MINFDEPVETKESDGVQDHSVQSLGANLQAQFSEYKDARKETENEWLRDLRQYNGQYEADVLARLNDAGARSKVFVGLTRTKVMAAYSRIIDLLFQHGDQFFNVESTPVPDLDPMAVMSIKRLATQQIMDASQMDPNMNQDLIMQRMAEMEEDLKEKYKDIAEEAAESMTLDILDQLVETGAEQKLKESILEACIFGSGAVKAGSVRIDKKQSYSRIVDPETGEDGFTLTVIEQPMPEVESVSVFDLYPDPYCTDLNDCDGLFRRHVLTRKQFRELADLPQFDSEIIKYLLKTNRTGNHVEEDHERTRRRIAGINEQHNSNRFELLEYWGFIDGHKLKEHDVDLPEDADLSTDFSACAWICAGKVIKITLNPIAGYQIPYQIFPYEKSPHQFWGTGVPRMMRDSQGTLNAATRIWLDNLAMSSAPMMEINTDLLAAGEDPTDIHPWRVFLREGGDGSMPMVRWYQPIANANGLNQIVEIFRRFADETTSLPSYTHGQQTNSMNKTATGMSMLMGAANVALKSTIKNIDDFLLEPLITAMFHWNMEYGSNQKSKGDLKIVARGSTALIQKEVQSQRLLQFLSLVSNDQDSVLVDRQQLIREIAKSMDIDADKIVKSEEQLRLEQQQQIAMQQQAQMQQLASQGNPEAVLSAGMG